MLFWAIFVVSRFHILYPLHSIIFLRRLLVVYWPNPLSDLDLSTASNINCKVLPVWDEDNYLHSEPNWSLLICIQRYSWKYHKWNIYLFNRCRLTYPDGDITSNAINQGSHFLYTGNTPQCTNVLFPIQHTISPIGVDVPKWTWFPPTTAYKHLLIVVGSQVFIFIGLNFSSILII